MFQMYQLLLHARPAAAAAAKLLQSCLTLCDPIDGSPPGSPVPGILQARTLEWVAISFSKWGARPAPPNKRSTVGLGEEGPLHRAKPSTCVLLLGLTAIHIVSGCCVAV